MESGRLSAQTADAAHPMILVVATDDSVRKMLVMAFTVEYQGEVVGVSNGAQAMKTTERMKPDLAVIYSQPFDLPVLALANLLHAVAGCEHMPIILTHSPIQMSSESQQPHLMILEAPFMLEKVYSAVDRCLGHT